MRCHARVHPQCRTDCPYKAELMIMPHFHFCKVLVQELAVICHIYFSSIVTKAMGWMTGKWAFVSRNRRDFLFYTVTRLALGPIQPLIQQVPGAVSMNMGC
jgi:hypothetical protein